MTPPPALHERIWSLRFISVEAVSGVVLLAAAALALGWANSPWAASYEAFWRLKLELGLGRVLPAQDLRFWVNDGLMTIFFLVVGLEIRREIGAGALSDLRVATLPMVAALGGVAVPALLYLLINHDPVTRHGWAIATPTDIAFAVGVLSLIGRVPAALRLLLLTLAIIDDIAAVVVIALYYSASIAPTGLLVVAAGVMLAVAMQRLSIGAPLAYLLPGLLVWWGLLRAGLHPALAGVLLGALTPATAAFGRRMRQPPPASGVTPLVRVEARLHPWVAFGIMPLFAAANAGVRVQGLDLSASAPLAIGSGIVAGLVLGKPIGIVLAARAAVTLKLCALPEGVRWHHIILLGCLGGIGFTMAIFIAALAFTDPALLAAAKFAVLVASGLAATLGFILGRLSPAEAAVPAAMR
jgi:Na+:H+ antiporter, NhaA family